MLLHCKLGCIQIKRITNLRLQCLVHKHKSVRAKNECVGTVMDCKSSAQLPGLIFIAATDSYPAYKITFMSSIHTRWCNFIFL